MSANIIEFSLAARDAFSQVFDKFKSALQTTEGKATAGALAVGALAAVSYKLVQATADAAEEQLKLSQRLGTSVEKFGALAVAARLSNVEQGELTAGIRMLNRSVGEAADGNVKMSAALKGLGISAKDPTEAFKQAVVAFSGLEESGYKTALGMQVFGRQYAALKPVLDAGIESLEESEEWARKVGAVFSTEAAQGADALNDSLDMVADVMVGIRNKAVGPMLPELAKMGQAFAQAAADSNLADVAVKTLRGTLEVMKHLFSGFVQIVFTGGEVLATTFTAIGTLLAGIAASFMQLMRGDFSGAGDILKQTFVDIAAAVEKSKGALGKMWSETSKEAPKAAEKAKQSGKAIVDQMKAAEQAEKDRKKALEESERAEKERMKTITDAVIEIALEIEALEKGEKQNRKTAEAVGLMTDEQKKSYDALVQRRDALLSELDAVQRNREEQMALLTAIEKFKSPLGGLYADLRNIEAAHKDGSLTGLEYALALTKINQAILDYQSSNEYLTATGADFWTGYSAKMDAIAARMPSFAASLAQTMADATNAAIDGLGDALADWIMNGGNLKDALEALGKQIVQKVISDIISDAIKRAIFDVPSAAAIGGAQAAAANAAMLTAAPGIGAAIGSAAAAAMIPGAAASGAGAGAVAGGAGAAAGGSTGAAAGGAGAGTAGAGPLSGAGGAAAGAIAVWAANKFAKDKVGISLEQAGVSLATGDLSGILGSGGLGLLNDSSAAAEYNQKFYFGIAEILKGYGLVKSYGMVPSPFGGPPMMQIVTSSGKVFNGIAAAGNYTMDTAAGLGMGSFGMYARSGGTSTKFSGINFDPSQNPFIAGWEILSAMVTGSTPNPFYMDYAEQADAAFKSVKGSFHGGMSYVPKETSYYLDAGERVLSPNQNADLTAFLERSNRSGGAGGPVTINRVEIHIMENATSIDQFAQLDRQTLRDKLGRPIIDALNGMFESGVRPEFAR